MTTDQIFINLSKHKHNNPGGLYLFIDTETTGIPKRLLKNGDTGDFYDDETHLLLWPRLIRLSYIIQDGYGTDLLTKDFIIKPDNFIIPSDVANIHGITTEIANEKGFPLNSVLKHFRQIYDYTRFIVGHNIFFDTKVITAEFLRNDIQDTFTDRSKLDTMGLSTDFCGIQGKYGYKYPTLAELHCKLFYMDFDGAHNSAVDVRIVAKCFWELKQRNII